MPQRGAPQFGPLCRMIAVGRGPSEGQFHSERPGPSFRAVRICRAPQRGRNCGFDLEHLCRMIAGERPVRAGHVVPPGRCGFAMVRRSGGATARPLDSIWSLSAA